MCSNTLVSLFSPRPSLHHILILQPETQNNLGFSFYTVCVEKVQLTKNMYKSHKKNQEKLLTIFILSFCGGLSNRNGWKRHKNTHTHTLTVGPTFTAGSSHQQFLGLQRAPDDPHHLHALLLRQVRILAVGALNHQTCNTERLTFWATSGRKPCAFNIYIFFSIYQNSRQHWCHLRHCSYEGRTLFTPWSSLWENNLLQLVRFNG